jgi:hypothetical protein
MKTLQNLFYILKLIQTKSEKIDNRDFIYVIHGRETASIFFKLKQYYFYIQQLSKIQKLLRKLHDKIIKIKYACTTHFLKYM